MKRTTIPAIAAMVIGVLCGCTPEETFVLVDASALNKAASGELASAKVEMVFDIESKDDPNLPGKIKRAALPYLGTGATIEIEKTEKKRLREGGSIRDEEEEVETSLDDAKMVGRFSIPVGTEEVLNRAPRSVLWLKYTPADKSFRLVPGNNVRFLNSALASVNDNVEFEYKGGTGDSFSDDSGTTIKIVGDEPISIGVAAVKVNGNLVIADSFTPGTGSRAVKINYDNEFYSDCAPCFIFGGIPSMPSESLKKKSSWD